MSRISVCADARTLTAAAYAPYSKENEASETPAYKAEVSGMFDQAHVCPCMCTAHLCTLGGSLLLYS